ncbi:hypothetical protein HDU76_000705 [Blyttiomyces sp. JEL0837]|nr:hypothetical protein HDU76_000705 [Blyttiomyces sp. JEL0837]
MSSSSSSVTTPTTMINISDHDADINHTQQQPKMSTLDAFISDNYAASDPSTEDSKGKGKQEKEEQEQPDITPPVPISVLAIPSADRDSDAVSTQSARTTTSSSTSNNTILIPSKSIKIDKDPNTGRLGAGSFGEVHRASYMGETVVVKTLRFSSGALSAKGRDDFYSEAKLLSKLRHPRIVRFYGIVDSVDTGLGIVMEYVSEGSLNQYYQANIRPEFKDRLQLALDIANGMNYLHKMNPPILHRDLKSMNVLINYEIEKLSNDDNTPSNQKQQVLHAKLCDFGLAAVKAQIMTSTTGTDFKRNSSSNASSSSSGGPQGTIIWMAPELHDFTAAFTPACDVFSFAVILSEIATWVGPYGIPISEIRMDILMRMIVEQKYRPTLDIPDDTNNELKKLIEKCWDADPKLRPGFNAIARDLQVMVHGGYVLDGTLTFDVTATQSRDSGLTESGLPSPPLSPYSNSNVSRNSNSNNSSNNTNALPPATQTLPPQYNMLQVPQQQQQQPQVIQYQQQPMYTAYNGMPVQQQQAVPIVYPSPVASPFVLQQQQQPLQQQWQLRPQYVQTTGAAMQPVPVQTVPVQNLGNVGRPVSSGFASTSANNNVAGAAAASASAPAAGGLYDDVGLNFSGTGTGGNGNNGSTRVGLTTVPSNVPPTPTISTTNGKLTPRNKKLLYIGIIVIILVTIIATIVAVLLSKQGSNNNNNSSSSNSSNGGTGSNHTSSTGGSIIDTKTSTSTSQSSTTTTSTPPQTTTQPPPQTTSLPPPQTTSQPPPGPFATPPFADSGFGAFQLQSALDGKCFDGTAMVTCESNPNQDRNLGPVSYQLFKMLPPTEFFNEVHWAQIAADNVCISPHGGSFRLHTVTCGTNIVDVQYFPQYGFLKDTLSGDCIKSDGSLSTIAPCTPSPDVEWIRVWTNKN